MRLISSHVRPFLPAHCHVLGCGVEPNTSSLERAHGVRVILGERSAMENLELDEFGRHSVNYALQPSFVVGMIQV